MQHAAARVADLVSRLGPGGDVLELACGTGVWTEALASHAHDAGDYPARAATARHIRAGLRHVRRKIWGCGTGRGVGGVVAIKIRGTNRRRTSLPSVRERH
jgi:hypothetical protein